jgi:hypothetical protein
MVKTRFFIRFEDTKRTDEQGTGSVASKPDRAVAWSKSLL